MRTWYKTILSLLLINAVSLTARSQDINFSQFYELPMLRNPALAGIFKGDVRVVAAYRNQWQSVTVPYQTTALGAEVRFSMGDNSDDYLTVGLQVTDDVAGDSKLSRVQLFPAFNFHKSINDNSYISAGAMAGVVQQEFDPTNLRFDDQYVNGSYSASNPTEATFDRTTLTYWDEAAGLSFNSSLGDDTHYYIGVGLFHFTEPKVAFVKKNDIILNRKWGLNLGLSSPTSDDDKFIVYADYFKQGGNDVFQGGFLYNHAIERLDDDLDLTKGITAGIFYRWDDAVIPVVKLDIYQFAIGVSYDVNVSKLVTASQYRGGEEITLSYRDYLNIRSSSSQKVRCPNL